MLAVISTTYTHFISANVALQVRAVGSRLIPDPFQKFITYRKCLIATQNIYLFSGRSRILVSWISQEINLVLHINHSYKDIYSVVNFLSYHQKYPPNVTFFPDNIDSSLFVHNLKIFTNSSVIVNKTEIFLFYFLISFNSCIIFQKIIVQS